MSYLTDLFLILVFLSIALFFVGGLYRISTANDSKYHDFGCKLTLFGVRTTAAALVIIFVLFIRS